MKGLKNRGVEDILIASVDGLTVFPQAIEAVYPKIYKSRHDNWATISTYLKYPFTA